MSAVATAEAVSVSDARRCRLVPVTGASINEIEAAEQKRWMVCGSASRRSSPSVFLGITFATIRHGWLGLAITAIVVDIFVLVWLAMTLGHKRAHRRAAQRRSLTLAARRRPDRGDRNRLPGR